MASSVYLSLTSPRLVQECPPETSLYDRKEEEIDADFDCVNESLGYPMIDVHRKPFRSLILCTIRQYDPQISFPFSGGTTILGVSRRIAHIFIELYAEIFWPERYHGVINLAGEAAGLNVASCVDGYVRTLLQSGGKEAHPIEDLFTLIVRLKNYRQKEGVVKEHTSDELDDTNSEPELSHTKNDPTWTKSLRRDVNVEARREKALRYAREVGVYQWMKGKQERDRAARMEEELKKCRRGKDAKFTGDEVEWFGTNPHEEPSQDDQSQEDESDGVQEDEPDAALPCRFCDGASSFPNTWALMAHEEKVHGASPEESGEKR